jgi:hypothetical protein
MAGIERTCPCTAAKRLLQGLSGFLREGEIVDKILQHRQVSHVQVVKLNAATPATELVPGVFGNFNIVDNVARYFVHMDESSVAAKNFDPGTFSLRCSRGQVSDTQPAQTDIQYLPQINELVGSEENRKRPIFAFVPLVFSFFHGHFFPGQFSRLWTSATGSV